MGFMIEEGVEMADRVGQQFGNYHLMRLLGQGSFAEVYLGEHVYLKTQAAIKVLQTQLANDEMESFLTGARAIALLRHPHIVRVLEFGVEAGTPFLVTSYAPNGSLRQQYPKGTQLPLESIVPYVKQIAAALQYAHDRDLLHRDIKPENILLGRQNELLLTDFGTTLITQSLHYQSNEAMKSSVPYMAPEQLHGRACPASDQYALGIVVYEWLSGDCPFHGSFAEITNQHMSAPPPPLHEKARMVSPEVEEVVLKALAKEPQQRFATISAFAHALEQASMSELPTRAIHPPTPSSLTRHHGLKAGETSQPSPNRDLQSTPQTDGQPRLAPQKFLHRRGLLVGLIASLLALGLLIIGGSSLYYATVFYPTALHTQATVTTQTLLTAQAQATARVNAQADATFAAMPPQVIYIQATSGSPVINDSLSDQNKSTWKSESHPVGSCAFQGGAYHVNVTAQYQEIGCLSSGRNFRNFAFQVQMTIIKAGGGGIVFRADSGNSKFYLFSIETGGNYNLYLQIDQIAHSGQANFISSVKKGLNQTNLLTVIAHDNDFYFYVNKQYVAHLSDSTLSTGTVGLFAKNQSFGSPTTEVVFSNAQVWTF
jgi:serine/threonine protein kinase